MEVRPGASGQLPDAAPVDRDGRPAALSPKEVARDVTAKPHLAPLVADRPSLASLEEGLGSSRRWRVCEGQENEVDDAWLDGECARLQADNARLEGQIGALSGQLSVTKDTAANIVKENQQLGRLLAQIPRHKDSFVMASDDSLAATAKAVSDITAAQQAQQRTLAAARQATWGDGKASQPPAKRVCMAEEAGGSEPPASSSDLHSDDDGETEAQATAVAAAALAVNAGDPAKALVDLLKVYMQSQKRCEEQQAC